MYRVFWDTMFLLTGYMFTYGQVQVNSTLQTQTEMSPITTTNTSAINSTAPNTLHIKKLVAAVHAHFANCPDSHSQFCLHGTCRFLILEETPACVCHTGFIGIRCEHADLLARVATNHREQTVATIFMLCILGSILLILLCIIINCWWRRQICRQSQVLSWLSENTNSNRKNGTAFCHFETVV